MASGVKIIDSKVTATSTNSYYNGINTGYNNNINISLSGKNDFVKVSSYNDDCNVILSGEETYTDGEGNTYSGTLTAEQKVALAGKPLKLSVWKEVLGAITITGSGDVVNSATIDGNTTAALAIAEDITNVNTVTYKRDFTADGGAYTIMLPFSFTASSDIKGSFYTLSSLEPTDEDPTVWKATMSSAISEIQANTPYIFVPSEDFSEMTFSNVTLKATESAPLTNVCANTNWKLHGVYALKTWTDDDKDLYGFAATTDGGVSVGEFVHFVTGATLKATRCYLEYSKNGFSKSNVVLPEKIIIVFPDETSSVIEPDAPENNGEIITPVSEITPNSGVKVWSSDKKIIIESKSGDQYRIIDLNGRTLRESRLAADREEITLSRAAGIVIVVVNGKTFKVKY